MGEVNIRFADCGDITGIMQFIDTYWKKGHILAVNKEMFQWQYCLDEKKVNFVVAEEDLEIKGILGFIPYSRNMDGDFALALWKTIPSGHPFLGVELLQFLKKYGSARNIVCPGINRRTTERLYRLAGMNTGKMIQWYRLGCAVNDFKIGKITDRTIPSLNSMDYSYKQYEQFAQLNKEFDFENAGRVPCKTGKYFSWRYFSHPVYDYIVLGIYKRSVPLDAVAVLRIQEYSASRVVRFVDYVGNYAAFPAATAAIDTILENRKAEYADMYEAGLDEDLLLEAGWKKTAGSGNIIPNYFAPFEQSNADIYYSTSDRNAVLFRGDGDQDRPNLG